MKLIALTLLTCICMMVMATTALARNDYVVTLKNDIQRDEITKPIFGK